MSAQCIMVRNDALSWILQHRWFWLYLIASTSRWNPILSGGYHDFLFFYNRRLNLIPGLYRHFRRIKFMQTTGRGRNCSTWKARPLRNEHGLGFIAR